MAGRRQEVIWMKKNTRVKNIILKKGADFLAPIILMFGFYIILHGHLRIGGGFQGGIIISAAGLLIYLGYGAEDALKPFNMDLLRKNEAIGAVLQTFIALLGLFFFAGFCRNILFDMGKPGDLVSAGTILFMNLSTGYKTLSEIGFLILLFIGVSQFKKRGRE